MKKRSDRMIPLPSRLYCRCRNFNGSVHSSGTKSRTIPPVGNFTLPWRTQWLFLRTHQNQNKFRMQRY